MVKTPPLEAGAAVVAGVPAAAVGGVGGGIHGVGDGSAGRGVGASDDDFVAADVQRDVGNAPVCARRNRTAEAREFIGPEQLPDHAFGNAGQRDGGDRVGHRDIGGRISDGQAGRHIGAFRDGKVPVLLVVVVPDVGAIIKDQINVGGAGEGGIKIRPVCAAWGHAGVGQNDILPPVASDMDFNVGRALQVAAGRVVDNGEWLASSRMGRVQCDRADGLGRVAAAGDGHVPVLTVVIVPIIVAIVEHHIDLGGVGGHGVGVLPIITIFGHGGGRCNHILPAVAADVNVDGAGVFQGAFIGIVANDDRSAAIGRRRIENNCRGADRRVTIADGHLPIVSAVVFPVGAVIEDQFQLRRVVGDHVGGEREGEGVGAGAVHFNGGPVVGLG